MGESFSLRFCVSYDYPIARMPGGDGGLHRRAGATYLSDVGKRVIDRTLFRLALMLFEIRLKLLFSFDGIGYEFTLRAEGQFADIAIRGAGSAADESDDNQFSVRHRDIMAGHSWRSQISSTQWHAGAREQIQLNRRCSAWKLLV
jgi:hypothetical protein